MINSYLGYKILVIDEIDVVQDTQYSLTTLRNILDARYVDRMSKFTLMITNSQENFWPYLFSRLDDGQIVQMSGRSLRGM